MKPAIKRKWVKALRGNYEQETGALQVGNAFCCLGVLRHCVNPKDERSDNDRGYFLSDDQLREFGLTYGIQVAIAENLNDCDFEVVELPDGEVFLEEPVPFEMIAGLIDHAL